MLELTETAAQIAAEQVRIQVSVSGDGKIPRYATEGSSGMDLYSAEDIVLGPMERRCVATGIRVAIPFGYEGQVRPRSGLALKLGIGMVNSIGTIDSDYRGDIGVLLINFGSDPAHIGKGERIAQLVICPVVRAQLLQVVEVPKDTVRGEGGFGSTGTK